MAAEMRQRMSKINAGGILLLITFRWTRLGSCSLQLCPSLLGLKFFSSINITRQILSFPSVRGYKSQWIDESAMAALSMAHYRKRGMKINKKECSLISLRVPTSAGTLSHWKNRFFHVLVAVYVAVVVHRCWDWNQREMKIHHIVRAWAGYWRCLSGYRCAINVHDCYKQRAKGIFSWKNHCPFYDDRSVHGEFT